MIFAVEFLHCIKLKESVYITLCVCPIGAVFIFNICNVCIEDFPGKYLLLFEFINTAAKSTFFPLVLKLSGPYSFRTLPGQWRPSVRLWYYEDVD